MQLALDMIEGENPLYLESELITYLGNKRGLLPFISEGVDLVKKRLNKKSLKFLDLFSGSGVVSRFMKQHASILVSNDIEYYANIVNSCYLTNKNEVDWKEVNFYFSWLNNKIETDWRRGFIADLYAPTDDNNIKLGERVFYTRRNAEYIDTARQHIEHIPQHIQNMFLAPLIVKASIHNNTGGVFKGFYKNRQGIGAFGGEAANALTRILGQIQIKLPTLSHYECNVQVIQDDAIKLSSDSHSYYDLVYLDPPYNQHPYGSNYFMLNLIATYQEPSSYSKVSGIPENWNRSPFNKPYIAKESLFSILKSLNSHYFLISYNSEGFIQKEDFISGLKDIGELTILETQYNTYRASRNLVNRSQYVTEYLFLLEKSN